MDPDSPRTAFQVRAFKVVEKAQREDLQGRSKRNSRGLAIALAPSMFAVASGDGGMCSLTWKVPLRAGQKHMILDSRLLVTESARVVFKLAGTENGFKCVGCGNSAAPQSLRVF